MSNSPCGSISLTRDVDLSSLHSACIDLTVCTTSEHCPSFPYLAYLSPSTRCWGCVLHPLRSHCGTIAHATAFATAMPGGDGVGACVTTRAAPVVPDRMGSGAVGRGIALRGQREIAWAAVGRRVNMEIDVPGADALRTSAQIGIFEASRSHGESSR